MRKLPICAIPLLGLFLCGAVGSAAAIPNASMQAHPALFAIAAPSPIFYQDDPDNPCEASPNSQECICYMYPTADGCVNPCLNDPNAPECCGTQIICQGGGGGGMASLNRWSIAIRHRILPKELMTRPRKASTIQCKP